MKVGALVKLSAYGKDRKRAAWIDHNDVGIVIKIKRYDRDAYAPAFYVRWCKSDFNNLSRINPYSTRWQWESHNHRKDLVYAK